MTYELKITYDLTMLLPFVCILGFGIIARDDYYSKYTSDTKWHYFWFGFALMVLLSGFKQ